MNPADTWRVLGYRPHPGQAEVHASRARFVLLVGGARFGKSLAVAREVLRELVCGPGFGWLVAPQYLLARPEARHVTDSLARLSHARPPAREAIESVAGARVECRSGRQPDSMLGDELDVVALCETAHLGREILPRYLRPRLVTRNGRLIAGGTPRGANWMLELFLRAETAPDWQSFQYATWDNPRVDPAEVESARALLAPEVFEEQYGGQFRSRSGRVFPEFTRKVHVRPVVPLPGAAVFRGVDFGYSAPAACLWVTPDEHGNLCVMREYYAAGRTIADLVRDIAAADRQLRETGLRPAAAWADPSNPAAIAELCRAGVAATRAGNSVVAGIDRVRTLLRGGQGSMPGLFIDPACVNLIEELETCQWADAPPGRERAPAPGNDHALDALRYVVTGLHDRVGWQVGGFVC
ncbi:MAG: hypothetical protein HS108_00010 [Planctomycetes bacterium]|jgi:hypothetical protein|nr:hypothetical protein [Planctomycetota bacterium]MCL4732055.1 hypothetical protein [Planctomycetota bacterium]